VQARRAVRTDFAGIGSAKRLPSCDPQRLMVFGPCSVGFGAARRFHSTAGPASQQRWITQQWEPLL